MLKWWKIAAILLVGYTVVGGLLMPVPRLDIVNETIRNLYFHVPMWFAMIVLFSTGLYYSLRYLLTREPLYDVKAAAAVNTGLLMGSLGIITGAVWARFTWGEYWSFDPKQNFAAISLLLYFAYFVLRGAVEEQQLRARIGAVYSLFAFPLMVVLLFILPRLQDSLHPGNGGNPAFSSYDLDSHMRMVFYPACIGWILMGVWIYDLRLRVRRLELAAQQQIDDDYTAG